MKILFNNAVNADTLSVSSEVANFPFIDAILDKRLSRFGKANESSLTLYLEDSNGIAFTDVLMGSTNINGTVKIQANIDDDFTSPQFEADLFNDGENWVVANLEPEPIGAVLVDENGEYFVDENGASFSDYGLEDFKFIRIIIESDSAIEFSKLFVGTALIMPGISTDAVLPVTSNAEVFQNESGQIFSDRRVQIKSAGVNFPDVTEAERKSILEFFKVVDLTDPFWIMIWESSLDVEPVFYATLTSSPTFQKKGKLLRYSLNFNFREVK